MADDPPFQHVAIVGVGLIGGSIALGLRERWPSVRITGIDRPAVLAHARGSGAIDQGAESVGGLGTADLVVLAAPVRQNVRLLSEIVRRTDTPAVVTDVGGTKCEIVRAAMALPAPTFVGGHPIGGAERGGFGFARPDLFGGRPWIFTPVTELNGDLIARLFRFVQGLGARPSTMEAREHDRLMAFLSHLPQLTATALMEVIGGVVPADALRFAGRGLVDTTRLASSPGSVWEDICVSNAEPIRLALDQLIDRLSSLRADLDRPGSVQTLFDVAGRRRTELMSGRE
jgi:prephenate dehydrogenase